mmetsp:Transcript_4464/g.13062  ORF Transcript_4464/g.13062 Transcript_4464/m.13062 type:complete len:208 (+) Transcript_4464:2182-2805(+)
MHGQKRASSPSSAQGRVLALAVPETLGRKEKALVPLPTARMERGRARPGPTRGGERAPTRRARAATDIPRPGHRLHVRRPPPTIAHPPRKNSSSHPPPCPCTWEPQATACSSPLATCSTPRGDAQTPPSSCAASTRLRATSTSLWSMSTRTTAAMPSSPISNKCCVRQQASHSAALLKLSGRERLCTKATCLQSPSLSGWTASWVAR